jgi:hypothetical protein
MTSVDAGLASSDVVQHHLEWGSRRLRRLHGAPWSRGLNAVPYCPDRRLPGDSGIVLRPSVAAGQPLVHQGTPVQELVLGCQVGLKAVPKGPLVVRITTFAQFSGHFACPIARARLSPISNLRTRRWRARHAWERTTSISFS